MKTILTTLILFFNLFTFAQNANNKIQFNVDQLAAYQGGYEKFNKYITESINCKIKINKKEKNDVELRFVVEKDGQIKHVQVLSEKPFVCSEQIVTAIKKCKGWRAALKDNIPVRSIVTMDVNFDK